jgi:hypothetical protein
MESWGQIRRCSVEVEDKVEVEAKVKVECRVLTLGEVWEKITPG